MYWFHGTIKKAEEIVLAVRLEQLPEEMQNSIVNSRGYHLGAYVPSEDKIYIWLPDFKRLFEGRRNPLMQARIGRIPEMSEERFERLFMDKFLDTIEHESLHSAMHASIEEWTKGRVESFNEEVVDTVMRLFMSRTRSPDSLFSRLQLMERGRPILTKVLSASGENLVHEILVRFLQQKDSASALKEVIPYVQRYAKVVVSELNRMVYRDLPNQATAHDNFDDDYNDFYQAVMSMMGMYWSHYMQTYFDWNIAVTSEALEEYINSAIEELQEEEEVN
tara:strand:+ start:562 stop:1392 length:831 start_codon:yes stop_codon:yes gene_type:complete